MTINASSAADVFDAAIGTIRKLSKPAPAFTPETLALAAGAIRELIELKYNQTERWERMLPGERLPAQARRDRERREELLAVAAALEGGQ